MPVNVRSKYPFEWKHHKHENVFIGGKQKTKLPPLDILNWLFRYDPNTGKLFKIRSSLGRLWTHEKEITAISDGYLTVGITDSYGTIKMFKAHQISYYMHTGVEPLSIVDHCNGNPLDNRFSNLRLATESLNQRNSKMRSNNTSGYVGVYWNNRKSKWIAQIKIDGKQKHIGYYDSPEEANQARLEYVGTFNLHNLDEAFSYRHTNGD